MSTTSGGSSAGSQLSGLAGFAADIISALGEVGVGLLTLLETVFPPIPSEVVLPLAGFVMQQGQMNMFWLIFSATLGGYTGALVLYWLGRKLGQKRTIGALSKLPLLDRSDFERAAGWFDRHGRSAVFFGRLIPGVRSLISLPAGAERMPVATFSLYTIAGTLLWNCALICLGYLLGTQYHLVDKYSGYLNTFLWILLGLGIAALIIRSIRRSRNS